MSEFRTGPARPHPEVAGWVLDALDTQETIAFQEHLPSCAACQAELLELQPLRGLLDLAAPPVDLPPGLQTRTLSAVRNAAGITRRRRWIQSLLAVAAVIAVTVTGGVLLFGRHSTNNTDVRFALTSPLGRSAQGTAVDHNTTNGWRIALSVKGLTPLGEKGGFYECWYVAKGDTPARPDRVSAGTFEVPADGRADVRMWGWANPHDFPIMEITHETPTDTAKTSRNVVLSGQAPN